ncbi:MAG: hypothetical protein NZ739_05370 [Verrucomicrobiae bacterium]|nr:hypothetical protein [Verrucomicrobiae bacterium]
MHLQPRLKWAVLAACLGTHQVQLAYAQPAFPGAEGAGAAARGGRGGDVYYVTSLYDYTSSTDPNRFGTLRYGIASATGPRTILFKVSGYIDLRSRLSINKPNLTIAGQTAPGDGICLRNYDVTINANDVVVRHLRVRLGTNALQEADSVWITGGQRIVLDHCTASWSVDETLSASMDARDLSVQWCFITESLNNSIHSKGAHGYGSIISANQPTIYSWHHNLYAHHNSRSPRAGSGVSNLLWTLDFRNNVIYNWGDRAGYSGGETEFVRINYIGNALVAGPDKDYNYAFQGGATTTWIYQEGNLIDLSRDGIFNPTNSGWGMFSGTYRSTNAPFTCPAVTTDPAQVALLKVLATGGALPWRRDAVDKRVAQNVLNGTGRIIDYPDQAGGWPSLTSEPPPADTDNDGMPDYWELAMGLDPSDPSDRNLTNAVGYSRLEDYLNWKAAPHALCPRNGFTHIDLTETFGGLTNLDFIVLPGSNCTVSLLADGRTLRVIAARKFTGMASFQVTVTNRAWQIGFGPVHIHVLITTTNAPNTPPEFIRPPDVEVTAGNAATNRCVAIDNDLPAQTVTFKLVDAPVGASIDHQTGAFRWPVPIGWTTRTNLVVVAAEDDGEPPMTSTQAFYVVVTPFPPPAIRGITYAAHALTLQVGGLPGFTYRIQTSTNLLDWADAWVTNSASATFEWMDSDIRAYPAKFYRVVGQ